MKTLRTRSFLLLIVLLMSLNMGPISAQSKKSKRPVEAQAEVPEGAVDDKESAVLVENLLAKSGHKALSATPGIWVLWRHGENLKNFQVMLYTTAGTLTTEVIVAKGKSLRLGESASNLLRLANKLEYVKVGLDTDDDLIVKNEARLKSLDAVDFDNNIQRVAEAADMVYVQVQKIRIN